MSSLRRSRLRAVRTVQLTNQAQAQLAGGKPNELVIDGRTLTHLLGESDTEAALASLASLCTAVVVCRSSPSQKASIVKVMREHELRLVTDRQRTGIGKWLAKLSRNLQVRRGHSVRDCGCVHRGGGRRHLGHWER
jgi:hypothetical protein